MANTRWSGFGFAAEDAVAAVVGEVSDGQIVARSGSGLTGITRPEKTEPLTIGGTGDSLTATTNFSTTPSSAASIWTGSPSGNITITTDLAEGQVGELRLTHASGKKVTAFSQSGMTFDSTAGSDTIADVSGDGTTIYSYILRRSGTRIDYTIVADTP